MKGIIGSIRSLLKLALVTCEVLIGALFTYMMVISVKKNDWEDILGVYIFFGILVFGGYCLGRVIAVGKDISFSSMLKGLLVAPLFWIYLVFKQIGSSHLAANQGSTASKPVNQQRQAPQVEKTGDGRKKDPLRGELRSKLARVKYDFNKTCGSIKVTCYHSGPLVQYNPPNRIAAYNIKLHYTVETYEDGGMYEYEDISGFMESTEDAVRSSIESQVNAILRELREKYNNYDDVEFTPGQYWVTSATPQYKPCIKRRT